jgi:DNA-directed RNA polymerase alpha subunit
MAKYKYKIKYWEDAGVRAVEKEKEYETDESLDEVLGHAHVFQAELIEEDKGDEWDELELSNTLIGKLKDGGVKSVEALEKLSKDDLEEIDGIGEKTAEQIAEALDK